MEPDAAEPHLNSTPDHRGRKEYPVSLALDDKKHHVPLHRRGRSKTFERFEDLLREAGYKETRVFTPESERVRIEAEQRQKGESEKRRPLSALVSGNGLGVAVANLLTGVVRRGDQVVQGAQRATDLPATNMPFSQKTRGEQRGWYGSGLVNDVWAPPSPSPGPRQKRTPRPFTPNSLSSDFVSPESSKMASSSSSRSPPRSARLVPDARTTLRHMISAPSIPHRRKAELQSRRISERPRSQVDENVQPPLPSNWLQTVKQAVLGSGTNSGAYVGGPSGGRGRTLRSTKTPQASRYVVRDLSIRNRSSSSNRRVFTPRAIRSHTSPGVVTAASVVCRSVPSSRSSSVCRGLRQGRERHDVAFVPSLGVTTVEGDAWPTVRMTSTSSSVINLDSESDDDSDDGEPCFARLIVPSKRQHSIQSLRKHLHDASHPPFRPSVRPQPSASSSLRRVFKPSRTSTAEDSFDDDALRQSWHQYGAESTEDAAGEWSDSGLPGFGQASKKRAPLPWMSRAKTT